jgi:PIN domain nuclease of toxin-antitoxin system
MDNGVELLLDTCAIVYISLDQGMSENARAAVHQASEDGRLHISPMSAWEIGMLMAKGRLRSTLTPMEYLRRFLHELKAQFCELSPELLVESSFLPGQPHGDPTDRILMATARRLGMVLVTRDRPILNYGAEGHLRTLAC